MNAATFFDGEEWREGVVDVVDGRMLLRDEPPTDDLPRLDGVVTGGFTDHHVHLQLVDAAGLAASTLGRVVDLGANVAVISRLAETLAVADAADSGAGVAIDFAGAFLTAPGGYPADRTWAPDGSFREIGDSEQAARAVDEMADAGAHVIKIASNTTAGPVFGDDLFRTIVTLAASRGLSVVAHAEGPGEAQRAARLGAARLAHAPFTERLSDDEIAEQAASVAWISTLAIHDGDTRATALDNVRRFHAAGGTVLYGTDMGNGPTPVGLNPSEIAALHAAGLDDTAVLRALAPADPLAPTTPLLFFPGESPATAQPLRARRLAPTDLKV